MRHALVVPEVKVVILRVFPVEGGGGLWGTPMSYMSSLITVVPPTKSKNCPPIFVDHDKIFKDILSIFAWHRLI